METNEATNTTNATSVKKLRATLAGLLALTVVSLAAGCGGGSASSGPSLTVGSKNFTEQVVLGELYAQVLEANDFDVNRKLDLGNVTTLDQALQSGEITMYPEYTGTSLVQALGEEDADYPNPQATYDAAEEGYESRDPAATLLASVDFNNTYGITVPKDVAKEYDLETVADLAEVSDELTLASFGECQENPACFPNIKDNYDINFKDVTVVDSLGLRYQALKQGNTAGRHRLHHRRPASLRRSRGARRGEIHLALLLRYPGHRSELLRRASARRGDREPRLRISRRQRHPRPKRPRGPGQRGRGGRGRRLPPRERIPGLV
jgi:glycine betaine/choline ABC-type transport system substrate-binding protein